MGCIPYSCSQSWASQLSLVACRLIIVALMLVRGVYSLLPRLWRRESCRTLITEIKSIDDYQGLFKRKDDELLVIQFSAEWCGPCRKMKPFVKECSDNMKDASFYYVDIDENSSIAEDAGIVSVPTFHIVRNGEVLSKLVGADPVKLEETIKNSKK